MGICVNNLWTELSVPLKSFVKKRVNNDADAEDILQEVFEKIAQNIEGLQDDHKINAWVFRITRNAIIDYYRRNYEFTDLSELSEERTMDPGDEMTSNAAIAACLKTMIESLPDKYKEAILLTEFQNLTQKELGERMGLSLSGAKSRVQRGKDKLKETILSCCELEFDRLGNVIDYRHKSSECKYC